MTRDKVSLRLNLCATYRYTDVLRLAQLAKACRPPVQGTAVALRAAGHPHARQLLENKTVIIEVVTAHMAAKLRSPTAYSWKAWAVKDIVLPGEDSNPDPGSASPEAGRGQRDPPPLKETAATRSLLNTAKVMEDNPVALRMKELETLSAVRG